MAGAKTTVAVATTNNAAKDDAFGALDWLVEDGKLGNGQIKGSLAVLANDPGSAKIVGWSDALPATQAQLTSKTALMGGKLVLSINAQGQLDIDASGLNSELQALGAGQSREYSFYYTAQMANGAYSSARVSFVVTGSNDAPTVSAASVLSGVVTDTAADDSFSPLGGAVVGSDVDANDAGLLTYSLAPGENGLSAYGTFLLNPNGTWSFTPNDAAVEALKTSVTETFDVRISDGHGGSTTATVSVVLNGVNDTAEIGGTGSGSAAEDGVSSAGGTLTVTDRDSGDTGFQAPSAAALQGTYGSFTFDPATGQWSYALANGSAAVQRLGASSVVHDTLTVTSADGSASRTIDLTVTGANDDPTISAASVLSGSLDDTADDDSFGTLTGAVVGEDIDVDDTSLTYSLAPGEDGLSPYGTFTLNPDGSWTFAPDDAAVEKLKSGTTESFAILVKDGHGGSVATSVSIVIMAVNDTASIGGQRSGVLTEDTPPFTAGGTLVATDRDVGDTGFDPALTGSLQGDYGLFTFDETSGEWTYTLDNDLAAVQALGAGEWVEDKLDVWSADGTASEQISVTVYGSNDDPTVGAASVLSGAIADSAADDSYAVVSGAVVGEDVDSNDAGHIGYQLAPGEDGLSAYGVFALGGDGSWTFTANDAAVEGLKTAVTEIFSIKITDGHGGSTLTTVSIDLNGVNDTASIAGTRTGSVTEDSAIGVASGTLTASDRDSADSGFQTPAPAALSGTYGTFTFNPSSGAWTYTLDNGRAATQALTIGQTAHDTLTVKSADGTATETIDVTVNGAYDTPAVFAGTGDPNDNDNQATGSSIVVGNGNSPTIRGTANGETINGAGNQGNNTIFAGAGNDTVNAGIGNDTVYGGSGNDILNGQADNDGLFGGSGNDTINGNDNNDTIVGGYGADALNGGLGNDRFVYLSKLDTGDTISGFTNVTGPGEHDSIDLSTLGVTGFAGLLSSAGAVGAHQVGYMMSGGNATLYVDTDGVFGADLEITLLGHTPKAADFIFAPPVP